LKDDLRSIVAHEERSNHCAVARIDKCGSFRFGESKQISHSYDSTDGKCEILKSDYSAFAFLIRDVVDVTEYIKDPDLTERLAGYKCCCDKKKGVRDLFRGIDRRERANYCTVVKTTKCGSVEVDSTTEKAHSYDSTDGKCEIKRMEVPKFSTIIGKYVGTQWTSSGQNWESDAVPLA